MSGDFQIIATRVRLSNQQVRTLVDATATLLHVRTDPTLTASAREEKIAAAQQRIAGVLKDLRHDPWNVAERAHRILVDMLARGRLAKGASAKDLDFLKRPMRQ